MDFDFSEFDEFKESFELDDDFSDSYNDDFDEDSEENENKRIEANRRRRSANREKARKKKLFARRATIVGFGVLLVILIGAGLWAAVNGIVGSLKKQEETVAPTVAATEARTFTFNAPEIADDKKVEGYFSSANSSVYIYNKAALEVFNGENSKALGYAQTISQFKKLVGDDVTVYNMVVPSHIEFSLPKRLVESGEVKTASQAENINTIYTNYTEDVIAINCYNKLSEHCKEYLYFNTDYYWTGLGAYYGYQAFCEQTDNKVLDLSVCTDNSVAGFEGQLLYCDMGLYENLDTVHYWTFPYSTYAMRTETNGAEAVETSIYYPASTAGSYTYGAFLWGGDYPLFVEYNKDLTNGEKILVVKDSFGNPFVPYLTANYEQVHIIDYRFYEGSISDYCTENGITKVLFINNIMNANSDTQQDALSKIF